MVAICSRVMALFGEKTFALPSPFVTPFFTAQIAALRYQQSAPFGTSRKGLLWPFTLGSSARR